MEASGISGWETAEIWAGERAPIAQPIAATICRQLGYGGAAELLGSLPYGTQGPRNASSSSNAGLPPPVRLQALHCAAGARRLVDCHLSPLPGPGAPDTGKDPYARCSSRYPLAVRCTGELGLGLKLRLGLSLARSAAAVVGWSPLLGGKAWLL